MTSKHFGEEESGIKAQNGMLDSLNLIRLDIVQRDFSPL